MGVANSAALDSAGIDANTPNPDGGMIARLPGSREPSGLVQETAMYVFAAKAIDESASKKASLFDQAQDYYAENGLTTAQEGMSDPSTIRFLQEEAEAEGLIIDVVSLTGDPGQSAEGIDLGPEPDFRQYHNGLKFEGIKIIADGSPQGKTAYFTEPYLTPVEGCESDCRGLPSIPQEKLNEMFTRNYGNNRQLFIHANGDASIDMIIRAHEAAAEATGQPLDADRRTVVVHAQFARPDQLETFKRYNMMPSFFTNHAFFWGDVHLENLGEERAGFLSPMRAADSLGLVYTNHTDATVTPIDQLFTVWTAVNRTTRSGVVLGPGQRVSPYQALRAITINAATQIFDEQTKGSLAEGKLADFVILDHNPLKVAPDEIRDITVVETIKDGTTVYTR
jgi:predicted amidohydrolase YtcJ